MKLQLSFIINHKLLDPDSKKNQNYKFDFEIDLINYRQEDGVLENVDQELFLSIKKIAQIIYENVPKKELLHISDPGLSHSLLNEILQDDRNRFLNYISSVISIINAKGKYQKAELKADGYEKKLIKQKSHIPFFKIEKQDIRIKLQVKEPFTFTWNDEEALPRRNNSFYHFFKNLLDLIVPDYNNIKNIHNNLNQGAVNDSHLTFSMKRQYSGLAQGNHSILTTPNLTISLSVIFVLVTILILMISMIT